ncbi:MAG: hypothetical protein OCC49_13665 [Fibrobacterales bacterium]
MKSFLSLIIMLLLSIGCFLIGCSVSVDSDNGTGRITGGTIITNTVSLLKASTADKAPLIINLYRTDEPHTIVQSTTPDHTGQFVFDNLPLTRYDILSKSSALGTLFPNISLTDTVPFVHIDSLVYYPVTPVSILPGSRPIHALLFYSDTLMVDSNGTYHFDVIQFDTTKDSVPDQSLIVIESVGTELTETSISVPLNITTFTLSSSDTIDTSDDKNDDNSVDGSEEASNSSSTISSADTANESSTVSSAHASSSSFILSSTPEVLLSSSEPVLSSSSIDTVTDPPQTETPSVPILSEKIYGDFKVTTRIPDNTFAMIDSIPITVTLTNINQTAVQFYAIGSSPQEWLMLSFLDLDSTPLGILYSHGDNEVMNLHSVEFLDTLVQIGYWDKTDFSYADGRTVTTIPAGTYPIITSVPLLDTVNQNSFSYIKDTTFITITDVTTMGITP